MPRKPIEWSKCIIYKIWNDVDFYVGSTTDFTNRKRNHKQCCNCVTDKKYNLKLYQTIREKGGWNAWQMIPLEEYKECQTQIEARIREEKWRVELNAQLNMRRAFSAETPQEHYEANKEQIAKKKKEYRDEHKEQISEKAKIHYEANKEQIAKKNKEYRDEHKEQINEKNKEYRDEHKEQILEKAKEPYECPCGSTIRKSNKAKHERSLKHISFISK